MHGRGICSRSLIWIVFSSRMRLPASHDSTMFCAIWSWGPTGLLAFAPWNRTEVSSSGEPCQNLRAGKSNTFASRSNSRNIRRTRLPKGAGISSAMRASVYRGGVEQSHRVHEAVHRVVFLARVLRAARVGDQERGLVVGD